MPMMHLITKFCRTYLLSQGMFPHFFIFQNHLDEQVFHQPQIKNLNIKSLKNNYFRFKVLMFVIMHI